MNWCLEYGPAGGDGMEVEVESDASFAPRGERSHQGTVRNTLNKRIRVVRLCGWDRQREFGSVSHAQSFVAGPTSTSERRSRKNSCVWPKERELWHMNDFLKDTLIHDPETLVYFEWTHPCQGLDQPPLQDLQHYMEQNDIPWLGCRVDGCVYGVKDPKDENFLQKKWLVKTNDEAFHAQYKCKVCHGGHAHSHIQGVETAKSAYYPRRLVQSWALFWRRSTTSDRQLRLLFLKHDAPMEWFEEQDLLELQERQALHVTECQRHDLPTLAAEVVEEPSVEEVRKWEARADHVHKASGHPTNKNLARIVKDSGQPAWKVEAVLRHKCASCQALRPGGSSSGHIPPAATHPYWKAWQTVGLDCSDWHADSWHSQQDQVKFVFIMDLASKLRALYPLMEFPNMKMRAENAGHIMEALTERWPSVYPKPEIVIADNGKSFTAERFQEFLQELDITPHFPAEKEPWAHGAVEAALQDLKRTATAIRMEMLDQKPPTPLPL